MKTLKSDVSEANKVQVDCLKDSESDSCDKNDMKEKVNDLVRFHKAMQDSSNPNSWYLINGLECTVRNILMPLNTLFELHIK